MKKSHLLIILIIFSIPSFICYTQNSVVLYPRLVESSSYLFENDFITKANYHPNYVIDDNPNTAWVEGVSGDGINEHITIFTSLPKGENIPISIRNGYQKSEDLFLKNNRVRELEIVLTSGTANNQKNNTYIFELQDKMGWQTINIKPPEDSWAILFIIRSVYKGLKYEDTCISDIKIIVGNPKLIGSSTQEELKRRYHSWFEERSKKAAFFSNLPKEYPFKAYKKTTYKKNTKEENSLVLDLEYYDRILKNDKLNEFISSPLGTKYLSLLRDDKFTKMSICNIDYKSILYTPEILSKNYLLNVNQYADLFNLIITISNDKPKVGDSYHKVSYIDKNIRVIDWCKSININFERLLSRCFYDDSGKLIFIKGEFAGEDGECSNDALFVWNEGRITEIYWFYVQWANEGGLDVQMTLYE